MPLRLGVVRVLILVLALAACDRGTFGPCGNGQYDPYEECDDGNLEAGDRCSPNCTREPTCGDRIIDSPRENCDDGNTVPGDNCDEHCRTETVCGDRDIEPGETCEDGNADPGDGCSEVCSIEYKVTSEVRWHFVTAVDQTERTCPDGADTIEIATQMLRDDDSPVRAPVVERLPCLAWMRHKQWWVGRYRVSVRALDAAGTAYAPAHEEIIDLRALGRDVDARFIVDGGTARVAWRLVDGDGAPRTCAQLGILDITVAATSPSFSSTVYLPCGEGRAETAPLPAGGYTLQLTAFDSLGTEMGIATRAVTITAPSGSVDAGTVDVGIDPG